jgi:glycosyltransferase involved in cell wall biosynthesis
VSLTVFSVIRNGIQNGYPFVEAYGSWLDYCDRLVVVDGQSSDGTRFVLDELAALDDRIAISSRPWPAEAAGGAAIAAFTNDALALAEAESDYLMYVQADEIYTRSQRMLVRDWEDGALEFAGCVNFWNSTETVVANTFPMRYLRAFPAGRRARSIGDGFTFEIHGVPVAKTEELILHYGWCFPVNILQKHVNHAGLYRDNVSYRLRGVLAKLMLARRIYDRRLLDALAPHYLSAPYTGEHPECVLHLRGLAHYDPYLGLDRLRAGIRW